MEKIKAVFLTGATGFVGSHLAHRLLREGYNLKLLVRRKNVAADERMEKTLSSFFDDQNEYKEIAKNKIEIVQGDITHDNLGIPPHMLNAISSEIDVVFHCAALTSFDQAQRRELEKQNAEGTRNVLDFTLKLRNADFHYVSTAYVCGRKDGIFCEHDLDVGQSFNNPYEETKFKAEQLVNAYRERFGVRALIYRPSIIVGHSETGMTSNPSGFYSLIRALSLLIEIFKKDIETGGKRAHKANVYYTGNTLHLPLRVLVKAARTLNIVPIDYAVDAMVKIMEMQNGPGKTYHIVNRNPPTIYSIHGMICSLFNLDGIRLVDADEFAIEPMSPWEEFFAESIRSFTPYMQGAEQVFSDENTQEILEEAGIKCPQITQEFLAKQISYCLNNNWGRK